MNHKEISIILHVPVPIGLLHISSVLVDLGENVHDKLSTMVTSVLKNHRTIEEISGTMAYLIADAPEPPNEYSFSQMLKGFVFLYDLVNNEIVRTFGSVPVKALQAVHFTEPDTVIVTFFSDGHDAIYQKLYPRT